MDIKIRLVDTELPLPSYKTEGAVAMDLSARIDAIIEPGKVVSVPLNVAIKPPVGHFVLMAARSSLQKRGLMLANNVGIFDEDFAGDGDEYHAVLYNFSKEIVEVKRGERLTQIIVLPYDRVNWEEVNSLGTQNRGGFGTTGR